MQDQEILKDFWGGGEGHPFYFSYSYAKGESVLFSYGI